MKNQKPETARAPPPPKRNLFHKENINKMDRLEADSQKKILNEYYPE